MSGRPDFCITFVFHINVLKKSPFCPLRNTELLMSVEFLNDLHQSFVNVESSHNIPYDIMLHAVESFLKVNSAVEELALMLQGFSQ
ncbi:hypothetical protein DPMN_105513 [Dreissena polymorpha]|uniref:Uncharacterized protein n=1 Tax=Dreissena polymorpha TaxID=45954 RepID=A0A9D4QIQ8_DREPO|nr:hypothetical protein DPMN_105513 [Dreissena polymorpha]